ncbi:KEA3, partial [Symbiodinium necroappetens]
MVRRLVCRSHAPNDTLLARPPARKWLRRAVWSSVAFLAAFCFRQKAAVAAGAAALTKTCLLNWLKAGRHFVNSSIDDLLILLFATTLIVPLMKKLRTSPIIGFLLIGLILGPAGADVIRHIEVSHRIADFGIIFFLFETGLELSVKKVVSMRGDVFGLGMAQFLITGGLLSLLSPLISSQLSTGASLLMGGGLALSSSAFALQLLRDKRQLGTRFGRASLGVLLFQDMAVVPLLVLAPLLGDPGGAALPVAIAESFGKAVLALGIVVATGHFFLRPLLAFVKRSDSSEAFLAVTLGTVLLSSSLTQAFGLSETLGAFVGGVLVAETDYKHQIE